MTVALFIRHGESLANADSPSDTDHAGIPLTALGAAQAADLADRWRTGPDLIVSSPFERAMNTAAPTRARFPAAPFEIWPIHEFSPLDEARCRGTRQSERLPMILAYWDAADPDMVSGEGAESFRAFIGRVDAALARLAGLTARRPALFCHGWFMEALEWRAAHPEAPIDAAAMHDFRTQPRAAIPNCAVHALTREPDGWRLRKDADL